MVKEKQSMGGLDVVEVTGNTASPLKSSVCHSSVLWLVRL